jgi:hypothetical protein
MRSWRSPKESPDAIHCPSRALRITGFSDVRWHFGKEPVKGVFGMLANSPDSSGTRPA